MKGFRLVALILHPVDSLVCDDIGQVTLLTISLAVHLDKVGVVVIALTWDDVPIVKACGSRHEVPLANECGLVARLLHQLRHSLLRTIEDAVLIVGKAIFVAVLTSEHTCTAGARQRIGYVGIDELDAVGCNTIQIGGGYVCVVIARHHLRRVVVGHDIDDVVALLCQH